MAISAVKIKMIGTRQIEWALARADISHILSEGKAGIKVGVVWIAG